mmetsp:Transcript_48080/g.148365  ORF Transcript_48080/g.148365 Transcript_48080/m.148365 type:complete len:648 (-) Transcript_48080:725-2668(-)
MHGRPARTMEVATSAGSSYMRARAYTMMSGARDTPEPQWTSTRRPASKQWRRMALRPVVESGSMCWSARSFMSSIVVVAGAGARMLMQLTTWLTPARASSAVSAAGCHEPQKTPGTTSSMPMCDLTWSHVSSLSADMPDVRPQLSGCAALRDAVMNRRAAHSPSADRRRSENARISPRSQSHAVYAGRSGPELGVWGQSNVSGVPPSSSSSLHPPSDPRVCEVRSASAWVTTCTSQSSGWARCGVKLRSGTRSKAFSMTVTSRDHDPADVALRSRNCRGSSRAATCAASTRLRASAPLRPRARSDRARNEVSRIAAKAKQNFSYASSSTYGDSSASGSTSAQFRPSVRPSANVSREWVPDVADVVSGCSDIMVCPMDCQRPSRTLHGAAESSRWSTLMLWCRGVDDASSAGRERGNSAPSPWFMLPCAWPLLAADAAPVRASSSSELHPVSHASVIVVMVDGDGTACGFGGGSACVACRTVGAGNAGVGPWACARGGRFTANCEAVGSGRYGTCGAGTAPCSGSDSVPSDDQVAVSPPAAGDAVAAVPEDEITSAARARAAGTGAAAASSSSSLQLQPSSAGPSRRVDSTRQLSASPRSRDGDESGTTPVGVGSDVTCDASLLVETEQKFSEPSRVLRRLFLEVWGS